MNLSDLSYSAAYDLGGQDFLEGRPRRTGTPRSADASAGRFGYADGYHDAAMRHGDDDSGVSVDLDGGADR